MFSSLCYYYTHNTFHINSVRPTYITPGKYCVYIFTSYVFVSYMQMVLFFLEPCERFRSCCFCVYSKCVAICGQISLVIFVLVVVILMMAVEPDCVCVYVWFNFDVMFPYPYVLVSALLMLCLRALQVYIVGAVWCG